MITNAEYGRQTEVVAAHCQKLYDTYLRHWPRVNVVTVIEGTANFILANIVATTIEKILANVCHLTTINDPGYIGVHTNDEVKHAMVRVLSFCCGTANLAFEVNFFTNMAGKVGATKAKLKKQLLNFKYYPTKRASAMSVSGKGENGQWKDDLGMALFLVAYWTQLHMKDGLYTRKVAPRSALVCAIDAASVLA